jgi:hypothetical protein
MSHLAHEGVDLPPLGVDEGLNRWRAWRGLLRALPRHGGRAAKAPRALKNLKGRKSPGQSLIEVLGEFSSHVWSARQLIEAGQILLRNMSSAWSADIMGQLGQLESELKASQQKSKQHAVQETQAFPVP